jgi:hypothetical protein
MNIFVAGSISIKSLNEKELLYIDEIIKNEQTILIGDALGVDKAVQEYLLKHNYQKIIVYFSGEKVRNNLGSWHIKQHPNPENLTGKSFYQIKDKAMARDCDCGLFFWDGKSKGTKHNMDCLDALEKQYLIVPVSTQNSDLIQKK